MRINKQAHRHVDLSIVLLVCCSTGIGLLLGYYIFQTKTIDSLYDSVGGAGAHLAVVMLLGGGLYFYSKRLQIQSIKLRLLANTDPLTGCLNRRALADAFDTNRVHHNGGALFVLDLDYFKCINDEYGHDAGDYILKHFTKIVRSELREADLLARIGGEEFVVFLPETSRCDAYIIADRTIAAIQGAIVEFNGVAMQYTVSVGAVFIPQDTDRSLSIWLSVADRFLYRAKDLGRNQIFPSRVPSF